MENHSEFNLIRPGTILETCYTDNCGIARTVKVPNTIKASKHTFLEQHFS